MYCQKREELVHTTVVTSKQIVLNSEYDTIFELENSQRTEAAKMVILCQAQNIFLQYLMVTRIIHLFLVLTMGT